MSSENNNLPVERVSIGDIPELKMLTVNMSDDHKEAVKLSAREIDRLKKDLADKMFWGPAASLPMTCQGPKCPVASTCVLQQIGRAPLGAPCPIELTLINKWKDDYLSSLGASWDDKIERQAIMDLVETEVMRHRANGIIAKDGFEIENAVGVNPQTGEAILVRQKHIALDVSDQLAKRQERLLKSLLATREMKEKLGKGPKDQSLRESEIRDRARKLREKERLERMRAEGMVHDAEIVKEGTADTGPTEKAPESSPPENSGAGPGTGGESNIRLEDL